MTKEILKDLEQFKLVDTSSLYSSRKNIPAKPRSWFLKGPIPGNWLHIASGLPGRSLHVGLVIWFKYGLTKKKEFTGSRLWLDP